MRRKTLFQKHLSFFLFSCAMILGADNSQSEMLPSEAALNAKNKAEKFLVKDEILHRMYSVTDKGISMFGGPEGTPGHGEEIFLPWDQVASFLDHISRLQPEDALDFYLNYDATAVIGKGASPPVAPELPARNTGKPILSGVRIALDPGHVGGDMATAELEGRYIKLRTSDDDGRKSEAQFNEGNLTFATALLLRQHLVERGAEVMITRDQYGETSFGYNYETWKQKRYAQAFTGYVEEKQLNPEQIAWWQNDASAEQVFHGIFNWDDFHERSRKIDRFRPHITLIIHYNADPIDVADEQGYFSAVEEDFNMAFIPGSFMAGELDDPASRLAWLRLLLSDQIDRSLGFCTEIVNALTRDTGVPVIQNDEGISYLAKASLRTPTQGVYARNLAMTRRIRGTMCFAESLYEDNAKESARLAEQDLLVGGRKVSSRVSDVARAYYDAILAYTQKQQSERFK